ncbi:uncharacterized protein LOC114940494 [Nylanderia fulva]|uniref:uncharacterized protein LOC114940494 n=1 Tax=Nylanderia fulva TaxID=613905 RepID=UPI0010FBBAC7|nr:uncharacterized protein LOC114940494 [Nylanderia fulva]
MLLRWSCTWLTLPLLLSLSTGELSFYRDALPETPEDIALKQLARYLEAQQRFQQRLHRSHLATFLSPVHKKHSDQQLDHQEERRIEFLKATQESRLNRKLRTFLDHLYQSSHYHAQNRDRNSGYFYNQRHNYPEEKEPDETDNNDGPVFSKDLEFKQIFDVDSGGAMRDESVVGTFHDKYMDHHHGSGIESAAEAMEPEFTYKFDDSNLQEKHPFAVRPNDPRYYNEPLSSDDTNRKDPLSTWEEEEEEDNKELRFAKHEDDTRNFDQKAPEELIVRLNTPTRPERTGYNPLMVPMKHDLNNDIYFIAIVAGCSAAAMFALVLISLTWCRLQRGAKAAADIEYPAYGVTGPNKDVSPSGDQRLAQSAQMYHFQHQKQQIIAMENRTSATRDPGSLSEAESDEENEEGDYTVYECPGLASTGEMEVKNPMFHDDPTPATPAQSNNTEEDHI